jgi:hypothetical protein
MIRRQPLPHIRRQQEALLTTAFNEVLCHPEMVITPADKPLYATASTSSDHGSPEVNHAFEQIATEILAEVKASDEAEDELYGDERGDESCPSSCARRRAGVSSSARSSESVSARRRTSS